MAEKKPKKKTEQKTEPVEVKVVLAEPAGVKVVLEKTEPSGGEEVSERVETVIDRLVEYVQKKGKVDVKEVANAMALEKDQVEELAEVLKDSGMMDINYTLLGTFLIAKEPPKEKAKVEEKKERGQMASMMVALDRDLRDSRKSFKFVEQNIRKRLEKDDAIVGELEGKVHDVSIADMEYLLREARELRVVTKHFRKDIRDLRENVKKFHEKVKKLEVETMKAEQERLGPRKPWYYPLSMFFTRLKNTFKRR
ncbi:hypothetical protein H0N98_02255 [Candidatus Micrarchaeota archaeon]|nr:hypothetical protein [Candidatus Micrarchaeota archaeon]